MCYYIRCMSKMGTNERTNERTNGKLNSRSRMKLVMIEYSHLQTKCELEASFPPGKIYPWVDHDCVLAPPRQMLLNIVLYTHVKNRWDHLIPSEWQVWHLHYIGSWRHTCRNKSMKLVVNVNCLNRALDVRVVANVNCWSRVTHLMLRCWHAAWCSSTSPIVITWFKVHRFLRGPQI